MLIGALAIPFHVHWLVDGGAKYLGGSGWGLALLGMAVACSFIFAGFRKGAGGVGAVLLVIGLIGGTVAAIGGNWGPRGYESTDDRIHRQSKEEMRRIERESQEQVDRMMREHGY